MWAVALPLGLPAALLALYLALAGAGRVAAVLLLATGVVGAVAVVVFRDSRPLKIGQQGTATRDLSPDGIYEVSATLGQQDFASPEAFRTLRILRLLFNADKSSGASELTRCGTLHFIVAAMAANGDQDCKILSPAAELLVEVLGERSAINLLVERPAALMQLIADYVTVLRSAIGHGSPPHTSNVSQAHRQGIMCKLVTAISLLSAASPDAKEAVGSQGGLQLIMQLCRDPLWATHRVLVRCALCATAITCEDHTPNLARIFLDGAVETIKVVLDLHPANQEVLHAASVVLFMVVQGDSDGEVYSAVHARRDCVDCALAELLLGARKALPPSSPTSHIISSTLQLISSAL